MQPSMIGRLIRDVTLILGSTALLAVACTAGTILWHRGGTSDGTAECAMVFGAAVRGADMAGPGINRRLGTAVRLYQEGKITRLILSGGKGSQEQESEAAVMRDVAVKAGVPLSALLLEETSHSTLENLTNSLPLLTDCDTIVGVSDGYHLARIEMLADQVGLPHLRTIPADRSPNLTFELKSIGREVAAYLWYGLPLRGITNMAEVSDFYE